VVSGGPVPAVARRRAPDARNPGESNGKLMSILRPPPVLALASIVASWPSAIARTMARPSPVPSGASG
jgi:hypothetical protein